MSIELTRALIEAALDGSLATSGFTPHPVFKVLVPHECELRPGRACSTRAPAGPTRPPTTRRPASSPSMFRENFEQYASHVSPEVLAAGPDPDAVSA